MGKLPIRKSSGYIRFHPSRSVAKNQIEGEQQRADRDARVRNVERGPVIVACVQHDEIDDVTETSAVSQVAEDAREQQRARSENTIVIPRRAQEIVKDRYRSKHCQHYEKPTAKRAAFLQLSKRDARVFSVDKLKKPANQHSLFAKTKRFDGPRLCRLVGHVDEER